MVYMYAIRSIRGYISTRVRKVCQFVRKVDFSMKQGTLEKIPVGLQKIYISLEEDILKDIVRGIKTAGFAGQSTDYLIDRLQRIGGEPEEIKKRIQDALEASDQEIEEALSDAAYEAWYECSRVYKLTGREPVPYEDNQQLQQLITATTQQAQQECHNLSASYGFAQRGKDGRMVYTSVQKTYNDAIDKAILSVSSGAYSYDTALRRAVKTLTASGLRFIDYPSGTSTRADVAARRALMTGFRQIQGHINEQLAADIGTNKYEVSWHLGARPSHQEWQGKVYTYEELEEICGLGTVTGLHGANCYHDYVPFLDGYSTRVYTDEWLEEQNALENTPQEYEGKQYTRYEALQEQRRMERAMRAQRETVALMKEGGASGGAVNTEKIKYRTQLEEYRAFSGKMDLPEQFKRVYQDGLGYI